METQKEKPHLLSRISDKMVEFEKINRKPVNIYLGKQEAKEFKLIALNIGLRGRVQRDQELAIVTGVHNGENTIMGLKAFTVLAESHLEVS